MTTEAQVRCAPAPASPPLGADPPGTGQRAFRPPASGLFPRLLVPWVLLLCIAAAASGCGGGSGPSSTLDSAFAREYSRLHGDTDPGTLSGTPATEQEVAAAIRAGSGAGTTLLLPATLPSGFMLAAPFRGTGSGAALPNPHTWSGGYAVTYTDGRARLTVMVEPDEPVEGGVWDDTGLELRGRPLLSQERDGLVLVSATPEEGAPVVVVVGERLPRAEVLKAAAGLRAPDRE